MTSDYKRIWKLVIENLHVNENLRHRINYQTSSMKSCDGLSVKVELIYSKFQFETGIKIGSLTSMQEYKGNHDINGCL